MRRKLSKFDFSWIRPGSRLFGKLFPQVAERLRVGELSPEQAATAAYEEFGKRVSAVLRSAGIRDRSIIEDVVQETALRVSQLLARRVYARKKGSMRAFVGGVAVRVGRERWRRGRSRCSVPLDETQVGRTAGDGLDALVRAELLSVTAGLFPELTERQRLSIAASYHPLYAERPIEDIPGNRYVECHRGIGRLRQVLRDRGLVD